MFTSLVIFFILDINRPALGPINLGASNRFIYLLREIAAAS